MIPDEQTVNDGDRDWREYARRNVEADDWVTWPPVDRPAPMFGHLNAREGVSSEGNSGGSRSDRGA